MACQTLYRRKLHQWTNLPVLSNSDEQLELPELDKRWCNVNWPWSSYDSTYRVLGVDMIITMRDTEVTVPRPIIMHIKSKVIYGLGAEGMNLRWQP